MFAFQRELTSNGRSTSTGSSAGSTTTTVDQNCYGLPCNTVGVHGLRADALVTDFGPDNLPRHRRRPQRHLLRRRAGVPRQGHVLPHQLRQQRRTSTARSATRRSRCRSASACRTAGRCRARTCGRGSTAISVLDYTEPEQPRCRSSARAAARTISRTPSSCSAATRRRGHQLGANYQALSGLPLDRSLSVPLSQGSATVPRRIARHLSRRTS